MNAVDWINSNLAHPEDLEPETLSTVGDFTLMWAVFEASEGEELNNMLGQITRFSDRLAESCPVDLINEEFDYCVRRYINNGERNDRFYHLRFSDDRQSDLVFNTLTSGTPTLRDKLETCLLIVYRYRNNLFHGMKEIPTLNDQVGNFSTAISILQKLLPYGRAYWLGFPKV